MGNLWENSYNELLEVVKSIKHLEPLVYRAIIREGWEDIGMRKRG
jgi:hypothetical protein